MPSAIQKVTMVGGVNQLADQRDIQDTEVVSMANVVPTTPGRLGKRKGYGVAQTTDVFTGKKKFLAIIRPTPELARFGIQLITLDETFSNNGKDPSTLNLVVWISSSTTMGAMTPATGATKVRSWTNYGPNVPAFSVAENGRIFCLIGRNSKTTPGAIIQVAASGIDFEIIDWNFNGANTYGADVTCPYKGRTFFGGLSIDPSKFFISDIGDPGTIAPIPTDHSFPINASGMPITGATEVLPTATGTQGSSVLLVFSETETYQITGQPGTFSSATASDIAGDMQIGRVHIASGCISARTIATSPYGTLWCGLDDVWLFNVGQLPVRVGTKLRPLLQQVPPAYRYLVHAAYHNGFYKLALPTPGQEVNAHLPLGDMYWLDLRFGPPQDFSQALWYGPQQYMVADEVLGARVGTKFLFVDTNPGRPSTMLTFDSVYTGTPTQETPTLLEFDVNEGRDISSNASTALQLDGKEIATEILSKEYDFGDDALDKIYIATEVQAAFNQTTDLQLDAIVDGGAYLDTDDQIYLQNGFQLGSSILDTDRLTRQFQSNQIGPADMTQRFVGKTIQLALRDRPGYIIEPAMTTFRFGLGGSAPGVAHTAILTPGFYSDIVAVCDMLVAALTLAGGQTFSHNQGINLSRGAVALTCGVNWSIPWLSVSDASTRRLGVMLGFDTSADVGPALTFTAVDAAPLKQSASVDFGTLNLIYNVIPRRPS
jgi:hypothetical protein